MRYTFFPLFLYHMVSPIPRTCDYLRGLIPGFPGAAIASRGQVCECLNCPQPLPPPGPDSCQTLEFVLNVKGALNDDLSNPFQGFCGLQVNFSITMWSLSMCLVSPGGDTLEFIGPNLISGFASSALSVWDVTFVQSSIFPNPDPWLFPASGPMTSCGRPSRCFQVPITRRVAIWKTLIRSGRRAWKILVKNCTELEKGTFLNFSWSSVMMPALIAVARPLPES